MRPVFKILIIAVIITLVGLGLMMLFSKKLPNIKWIGILGVTMLIAGLILLGVCFMYIRIDIFADIINGFRR